MSVGNLRTEGNKSNNFPFQLASLKLFDAIYNAVVALGPSGGSTRTITSSVVTTSGSVTAGAKWVNFIMSDDFTGTVNGANIIGAFSFMMPYMGQDLYPAIPYTVTTGNIRIDKAV